MRRVFLLLTLLLLCVPPVAWVNYHSIANGNTQTTRFDVILVLGFPATLDGRPAPEQRERVLEAVREYRAGMAPRLIFSGGAVANRYTEAASMGRMARSLGVPAEAVMEEPEARNTIQNVFYAAQMMHVHGWHTAEVVSSPSHVPRASLILRMFDRRQPSLAIDWRTHPAPWPAEYSVWRRAALFSAEASYCLRLRLLGFPRSRFLPAH